MFEGEDENGCEYGGYGYGYRELMADVDRLSGQVCVEIVGQSVMGQSIPALRIGTGPVHVQYNGAFHANEWITSLLLMRFMQELAGMDASEDVSALMRKVTLWAVPMVNPDGVELVLRGVDTHHPYREQLLEWNLGEHEFTSWKSNIRGVDLNDQFPAYWHEERLRRARPGPGPRDYSGAAPLSEPEARSMAELAEAVPFAMMIAFHTQGEEIYWNYRDLEPTDSEAMAKRLGGVSGYVPVQLSESDAGYKDWFIQRFRKPGFTVEAGRGENPLPVQSWAFIYTRLSKLMLEGLKLAHEWHGKS